MDYQRFLQACELAAASTRNGGIGTLSEKTLHSVLKYYIEPYPGSHEIKIGGFVADIVGERGIVEIQTRGFDRLRRKLEAFLSVGEVTVVYPVAQTKWLSWIDPETGEMSARRKSPKRGSPYEIFYELYKIKAQLTRPGLHLLIVLLDIHEIRHLNGWSRDKKRGSSRAERIPLAINQEIFIETPRDYGQLIPPDLPTPYTTRDFRKASGLSLSSSQTALHVLHHVEAVRRIGKSGNSFLYESAL